MSYSSLFYGFFYDFYHQLVPQTIMESNRNTVVIFMKINLTHESVLKRILLALIRPFKWKWFPRWWHVSFLWLQNFVWPMSTLWIWDLLSLKTLNGLQLEVCSIRLLNDLLKCSNGKILLDILRSYWIWKYLIKLVRCIQKSWQEWNKLRFIVSSCECGPWPEVLLVKFNSDVSSLFFLILYWCGCQEKFHFGHLWELKGLAHI